MLITDMPLSMDATSKPFMHATMHICRAQIYSQSATITRAPKPRRAKAQPLHHRCIHIPTHPVSRHIVELGLRRLLESVARSVSIRTTESESVTLVLIVESTYQHAHLANHHIRLIHVAVVDRVTAIVYVVELGLAICSVMSLILSQGQTIMQSCRHKS